MPNPLQGWNIIPRNNLHDMIRDSFEYERELRERLAKARSEFQDRIGNTTDNRFKMKILHEVAAKYGFRESWFMQQVRF